MCIRDRHCPFQFQWCRQYLQLGQQEVTVRVQQLRLTLCVISPLLPSNQPLPRLCQQWDPLASACSTGQGWCGTEFLFLHWLSIKLMQKFTKSTRAYDKILWRSSLRGNVSECSDKQVSQCVVWSWEYFQVHVLSKLSVYSFYLPKTLSSVSFSLFVCGRMVARSNII